MNKTHPVGPTPDEITEAVQATIIAAAAAGNGAVAYFPQGSYPLTSTIKVSGQDFYVSGCGYQTHLGGGGTCTNSTDCVNPLIEVAAGSQVTFEFMQLFPANQTADLVRLLIHGNGRTNVTINGVQMQGYNENKRPWPSGIRVVGFVPGDLLDIVYTDGDITAVANEGTIIVGFHLAGQSVLEPSAAQLEEYRSAANGTLAAAVAGKGVFGELMRFTCCAHDYTTKITGAQVHLAGHSVTFCLVQHSSTKHFIRRSVFWLYSTTDLTVR
jgi:hypothetical protein